MAIKSIAVIGAQGRLGPSVIASLLESESFELSVISRASSKFKPSNSSIKDLRISDEMRYHELVEVLSGQDALVICIAGSLSEPAIKFADAALSAGVKRVIPADFGSCDSADPHSLELLSLYREKQKVRLHLEKLSQMSEGRLTWTSLITGHFLDYGIKSGLMQIDVPARKARTFDGGDIKWSATVLPDIGLATTRILQKPEETENKLLYIQSVSATQNELLKAVEQAVGSIFEVEQIDSNTFIQENLAKLQKDQSDPNATEELVSVEGVINANWETRENFANKLLGISERNLDQIVKEALQ